MTEQEYRELENYPYEPIFCSNEKECYDPKYLEMLKYATGDVELTNLEVRTLKWLSESDLYTVSNISRIIRKSREAERSKTSGLTKKDLLTDRLGTSPKPEGHLRKQGQRGRFPT